MAFYICRGRAVAFIGMLLLLYCSAQPPADSWANSTAASLPPLPSTPESASAFVAQPSSSSATTTPINVGDFIAAGFGLTRSADLVDDHETPMITETLFLTLSSSSTITIDGQKNPPLSNASTAENSAILRGNRSYALSFTGGLLAAVESILVSDSVSIQGQDMDRYVFYNHRYEHFSIRFRSVNKAVFG